jgi:hypothetical protein
MAAADDSMQHVGGAETSRTPVVVIAVIATTSATDA